MNESELSHCLDFAASLAAAGERIAKLEYGNAEVSTKADDTEVTTADLRIQRLFAERIRSTFPDHALLGEEAGDYLANMPQPGSTRYCWIVDPLDGTRNYVRGLPMFCASIALFEDGCPVVGLVRDYVTGDNYTAIHGHGAFRDTHRISVTDQPFDKRSVITFQPDYAGEIYKQAVPLISDLHLRNLGSTALHLAMIASGAADGGAAMICRVWDIAAGALLVEEAGGVITDWSGDSPFPFSYEGDTKRRTPFIAGSKPAHTAMIDKLRIA